MARDVGDAIFAGWSGDPDCIEQGLATIVTLNANKTCMAAFNIIRYIHLPIIFKD